MDFSSFDVEFENWNVPAIENLFGTDSQLRVYEKDIRRRYGMYEKMKNLIESKEGMDRFTRGYQDYGVVVAPDGSMRCKEWAPNARALYLKGEFNNFERMAYRSCEFGKWELNIPAAEHGACRIRHMTELKLVVETSDHRTVERISPWAKYVVHRNPGQGLQWLFWNPNNLQVCHRPRFNLPRTDRLRIYEAHLGFGSNLCEVSCCQDFTRNALPRIRDMGYNCVLLMALMENESYSNRGSSFANYFSTPCRFGSPEDMRELIQSAHSMGLMVMMDVMQHQAPRNMIKMFDGGSDYFDQRGDLSNRNFNYTKWEVLRFLMSNLRYYLNEFCFDGFRFNGVTSMLYKDRTFDRFHNFKNEDYFGSRMDHQSMIYLMLANEMIHRFHPNAITIAEDYSEMPTLCRPIEEGGFGFDYRSASRISDMWQKFITRNDEEWDLDLLFRTMTERRKGEKYIAFIENHDQSLSGRMSLSRHLLNRDEMYETSPRSFTVDRGLSLHKMIRLITHALAGDSYMNFMGNEFGHPDWVDFSSPSNNHMNRARRLFQLADDDNLRYKYLSRFDSAMNKAEDKYGWLKSGPAFVSRKHGVEKVFVFERAGLLFLFNFHPTKSYSEYRVGVEHPGKYEIILDTDSKYFGGYDRNLSQIEFIAQSIGYDSRPKSLLVHLPARSALVMANRDFFHGCCHGYNNGMSQLSHCSSSSQQHPPRHHSCSSQCGGNMMKDYKIMSYHDHHGSFDKHKCDHEYGNRGPKYDQHCMKSCEYKRSCCGYKKEEYAASKYATSGSAEARYW